MNNEEFRVSVIIPVYNGERFLAEAVESVRRQDHAATEIIIVDDGSTDGTAKKAAGFQGDVRYIYQTNSGPAAARNKGLNIAEGNIIGFLDVDDVWSENKLALQLGYLEKDPSLEVVLGLLQRLLLTGSDGDKHIFTEWEDPVMNMHLGSALFRRAVFDKVGFLDESLEYCEDWDWFMRAKEQQVSMVVHKDVVYFYRRHNQNITNDTETSLTFALKMLRYSLDRRRNHGNGQIGQLPRISDFATEHPGHSHKDKEEC